jgi:hypothetical protein
MQQASTPTWELLLAAEVHQDGGTRPLLLADAPSSLLVDLARAAGWVGTESHAPFHAGLDGVMTGIRQLWRTRPLATETIAGLRVPTLEEMARIKAWLLATRYTVRDYLDTVVLLERLGDDGARAALREFDDIYRQANGNSPLAEVVERLAAAAPLDQSQVDLASYRDLKAPWTEWRHLAARGRNFARVLARLVLGGA